MNGAWRAYGANRRNRMDGCGGDGSVALGGSLLVISLSFGLAVTLAILALRGVSGAHINPAVSTGFVRRGICRVNGGLATCWLKQLVACWKRSGSRGDRAR